MNVASTLRAASPMKLYLLLPIPVCAALFLAGCGGGGGGSAAKLDTADIAVVGPQHVTKAMFQSALTQEASSLKTQGRTMPKAGTTDYATVKNQILSVLVQRAEFAAEAAKDGIEITPAKVQTRLTQIKKQYFAGSEARYQAQLKQQGFTDAQVRDQIREQLLELALYNKVTASVKATDADVSAYYGLHAADYQTPESRDVREILVGKDKEALAKQIYTQVKSGGDFAALAKKYSQDPGSKDTGGKFTAKKGADVPEFDQAVFAATSKTNEVLPPVNTAQYGWFVIQPLAAIKPASTTPEKQVAKTIRTTLLQQKKNTSMSAWVTGISKDYCGGSKIKYQAGYVPVPDPCSTLSATNPTTT